MESISCTCITLRLGEVLGIEVMTTFSELFPFLRGTLVQNEKVFCLASQQEPLRRFPKMMQSSQKCKPLDPSDPAKVNKIDVFFKDPKSSSIECHINDWKYLLDTYLEKERLYVPGDESYSPDHFLLLTNGDFLFIQDKEGEQVTTPTVLVAEYQKSIPALVDGRKGTLVMVNTNVGPTVLSFGVSIKSLDGQKEIARYFAPNSNVSKELRLPPANLDMVVLSEEGMNIFLTAQNFQLIKNPQADLNDYLRSMKRKFSLFDEEGDKSDSKRQR